MTPSDAIRTWVTILAAAAFVAASASAAELPIAPLHKGRHVAVHHVYRIYVARRRVPHFGYYFGGWGTRAGGAAGSWYASTFALGGTPWNGTGALLASSPKGVAAIDCSAQRPDVCLAEPIVAPVPRPVRALLGGWPH